MTKSDIVSEVAKAMNEQERRSCRSRCLYQM